MLAATAAARLGAGYVRLSSPGWTPPLPGAPIEVVGTELPEHGLGRRGAGRVGRGSGPSSSVPGSAPGRRRRAPAGRRGGHAGRRRRRRAPGPRHRLRPRRPRHDRAHAPRRRVRGGCAATRPGADRIDAARRLAAGTGAAVLLKGPTTVVARPDGEVLLVTAGDARLATAGTGDVLSGAIAALIARGVDAVPRRRRRRVPARPGRRARPGHRRRRLRRRRPAPARRRRSCPWLTPGRGSMSTSTRSRHNVGVLRRTVAPAGVLAVVKADGYGHGAVPVAQRRPRRRGRRPGRRHRRRGRRAAGGRDRRPHPRAGRAAAGGARPSAPSSTSSRRCTRPPASSRPRRRPPTPATGPAGAREGRHRHAPGRGHARRRRRPRRGRRRRSRRSSWRSIWTHCAVADEPDDPYTGEQLARYDDVLAQAAERGLAVPWRHAANSAGALCHPSARYDVVRAGIAAYGIAPAPGSPTASTALGELPPGAHLAGAGVVREGRSPPATRISYGLRHRFERDTVVATVPVGLRRRRRPPVERGRRRGARRRRAPAGRRYRHDGPAHGRLRRRRHGRRSATRWC